MKAPILTAQAIFKPVADAIRNTLERLRPIKPRGPHYDRTELYFLCLLRYLTGAPSERQALENLRLHAALFGVTTSVPAQSVLTDFRKKIKPKGFRDLFNVLVSKLGLHSYIIAVDSSNFKAYANAFREVKTDKDAGWLRRRTKILFGYKLHLLIDAERELPIAFCITSANVHDSKVFRQLIRKTKKALIALADKGYCGQENRVAALAQGALPIIDFNPRRGKRRKLNFLEALVYRLRVAVERVFSRLKQAHGLDALTVRGARRVYVHAALSLSAMGLLSVFIGATR